MRSDCGTAKECLLRIRCGGKMALGAAHEHSLNTNKGFGVYRRSLDFWQIANRYC